MSYVKMGISPKQCQNQKLGALPCGADVGQEVEEGLMRSGEPVRRPDQS